VIQPPVKRGRPTKAQQQRHSISPDVSHKSQRRSNISRRLSRMDVDLVMECMDDELSPAQLKAVADAQKEHEKVFMTIVYSVTVIAFAPCEHLLHILH